MNVPAQGPGRQAEQRADKCRGVHANAGATWSLGSRSPWMRGQTGARTQREQELKLFRKDRADNLAEKAWWVPIIGDAVAMTGSTRHAARSQLPTGQARVATALGAPRKSPDMGSAMSTLSLVAKWQVE